MADKPEAQNENPNENVEETSTPAEPEPQESSAAAANDEAGVEAEKDPVAAALAEAEARADEFRDQYLRTAAEMENLRKRSARDVEQARKFALERFVAELLPVIDALEMGLSAASDAKDQAGALVEGTEMTLKQFQQVLERFGVETVSPEGEVFNPEFHEAMATQPSEDAEPDTVLTVVQKGYLLNGRVVRPARVLVAKAPE
ncbi:MAG: nucleotide exchange factor GrpE [Gammaproteobacteria bacterium]|nr:nucleotide exchange factor GrpE [Gammaproteobacteria bacterium]